MRDRPPASGSRWLALLLAGAGIAAYANSLGGAFVYDDWRWIESNPAIRTLDLSALVSDTSRPVWKLSLALNYAAGGLDVTGYHLVNVSIHLLAGLALFGLVRRTLLAPRQAERYAEHASLLAFAVALLWLVHPLQTQAVTYVVQRAESGMGLCYLATLYFATRAAGDRWRAFFSSAAVCTCAVGMGVKEVMVTAPVLVWLHDRAFLTGSALGALRGRPFFYAALAATWLVPLVLIGTEALFAGEFARPDLARPSPVEYARSQPAVVLHYLRLAVWPHPLVFSYGWPVSDPAASVLPTLLLGALAAASGWALWRNRAVGFLGAWFFGILAPTSSIQPIQDLAFEHRMYLSLAAVVTLVVLGTHELLLRADLLRVRPIAAALAVLALAAGVATARRNRDYRDEVALWRTVVDAVPGHAVAHYNLGTLLRADGLGAEAIASLRRAVELDPQLVVAHNNLGNALLAGGDLAAAAHHYRAALEVDPGHAEAHVNLGGVLAGEGEFAAAARHYRLALDRGHRRLSGGAATSTRPRVVAHQPGTRAVRGGKPRRGRGAPGGRRATGPGLREGLEQPGRAAPRARATRAGGRGLSARPGDRPGLRGRRRQPGRRRRVPWRPRRGDAPLPARGRPRSGLRAGPDPAARGTRAARRRSPALRVRPGQVFARMGRDDSAGRKP
jgi:tetratricopeptide (TPR) repeat protein